MFGALVFGGGTFGGGGLGIVPATLPAATYAASILLGGIEARHRVRKYGGPVIRDILNDAPNTCTLTVDGEAPQVGQKLRITIALVDAPRVLFAGRIQQVEHTFEGKPAQVCWRCSAIDDTGQANWQRPFGTWTDTSATTIASAITNTYALGLTTGGIAAGLPTVTITFDGSASFIACLTQLATAIGGYAKVEDGQVYLFLTDTSDPPDPIDASHDFLYDPPITITTDDSQLRTRVFGKGYGESIRADIATSETLIPIEEGALFPALGGSLIAGRTPDGAQADRLSYTGVVARGIGTLVGPGAAPGSAPTLALQVGAGVTTGAHAVSVVYVTATGKSLSGPVGTITAGDFPGPLTAPVAGTPLAGTGPDTGSHDYVTTFSALGGETVATGGASNSVTTNATAGELTPPSSPPAYSMATPGNLVGDMLYEYGLTFVNAAGETTIGAGSITSFFQVASAIPTGAQLNFTAIPVGPAGTTGRRLYRRDGGGAWGRLTTISDNTTTIYTDNASSPGGTLPPSTNTTGTAMQKIPVTAIPIGPTGTTARNLYRRFNGAGTFKLVTTIANNTATTYTDSVPNASLGAAAPGAATAGGNQIALSAIPVGAAAVTQREIYMSPAGGGTRRRVLTIADNTTTTGTITMSDATLAGQITEPASDTSGLQQPSGQVNAGATTIPVASAATFRTTGGWVELGGGQVVRYTGISGQTLTGIPATGPGSIYATVTYGSQAIPAPMLTGVTEALGPPSLRTLPGTILKGSAVHLWVEVNDYAAQAEQVARTGGWQYVDYLISDGRRGQASLLARCQADLAMFSRPLVTVTYATRDIKTKSGKPVTINLTSPAISTTLTIQEVTISEIDRAPGLPPRFSVTASSARFSLEDTLRQLIVKE